MGRSRATLAHEIKNPLTPIQLSAERLAVKLEPQAERADQETLRRGTQTIVTQVAAMKTWSTTSRSMRASRARDKCKVVDVKSLLQDVLGLYENLRPDVALQLPTAAPVIRASQPGCARYCTIAAECNRRAG